MPILPNDPITDFEAEKLQTIARNGADPTWKKLSHDWMLKAFETRYMYNFSCLGRPIIQTPVDIVAIQELIWKVKPDLIIETGIAHGGSLILSASMLALLDYCDAVRQESSLNPYATRRRVLGIDVDIRTHNRVAIEAHPMSHRIDMIQGSSISTEIISKVHVISQGYQRVLICLDSNHTHDHVLAELEAYAPLTSSGSYCCVFDTIVEDLPNSLFENRPWSRGNNPRTAVREYLRRIAESPRQGADGKPLNFEIDKELESKLLITVAPDGYLRRL